MAGKSNPRGHLPPSFVVKALVSVLSLVILLLALSFLFRFYGWGPLAVSTLLALMTTSVVLIVFLSQVRKGFVMPPSRPGGRQLRIYKSRSPFAFYLSIFFWLALPIFCWALAIREYLRVF